jgi:uncharacterized protein YjbI with pentapeptide repeats
MQIRPLTLYKLQVPYYSPDLEKWETIMTKPMDPRELIEILKSHRRFVMKQPGGKRANLKVKNLSRLRLTFLHGVNLQSALLSGADLSGAVLTNADLSHADLFGAVMSNASLQGANLFRADMRGTKLDGADLSGANLVEADLRPGSLIDAAVKVKRPEMTEEEKAWAKHVRENISNTKMTEASLESARRN